MLFCSKNEKLVLPSAILMLLVAALNFASAFGWPPALLALLHLKPQNSDSAQGICSGMGAALGAIALFLITRLLVKHLLRGPDEAR
jgi:hypothetical protein